MIHFKKAVEYNEELKTKIMTPVEESLIMEIQSLEMKYYAKEHALERILSGLENQTLSDNDIILICKGVLDNE